MLLMYITQQQKRSILIFITFLRKNRIWLELWVGGLMNEYVTTCMNG